MRAPRPFPFHLLLRTVGRKRGQPGTHGKDRPDIHGTPFHGIKADHGYPLALIRASKPQASPALDAPYGDSFHRSVAFYLATNSWPQEVPLPAKRSYNRAPKPGMGYGYNLYTHVKGVYVPGGDTGSVFEKGTVMENIQHHDS